MRRVNSKKLQKWIAENGEHEALGELVKVSKLSLQTLDKMVRGVYAGCPKHIARLAISRLTGINEYELFPIIEDEAS